MCRHVGPSDHKYGWRSSLADRDKLDLDGYESCAADEDE